MASETVRVEGLNQLVRNLGKVNAEYKQQAKAIHLKLAEPIARKAKPRVNTKSGRLAASIRPSGTQRVSRVTAGARLKYGGVNHYGWPAHNITGNPFLTEAIGESRHDTLKDYETLLGALIDRAWVDNYA